MMRKPTPYGTVILILMGLLVLASLIFLVVVYGSAKKEPEKLNAAGTPAFTVDFVCGYRGAEEYCVCGTDVGHLFSKAKDALGVLDKPKVKCNRLTMWIYRHSR